MLCFQCGGPLEGGENKCPNCGADLKRVSRRIELPSSDGLQKYTQKLRAVSVKDRRFFPEGEKIEDRFELGAMIGRGPFGHVYEALDSELEVTVALKIFEKEIFSDKKARSSFESQVKKARKLSRKNLVRVMDNGEHQGHVWVSMQHLEGLTLRKLMKLRASKDEVFELEEVERLVAQVSDGLHKLGDSHGDLKPENILFLPDVLKITDHFLVAGISKDEIHGRLGESEYLAPEIKSAKGKIAASPSESADVFSLGCIVSEMMFGAVTPPAQGDKDLDDPVRAEIAKICRKAIDSKKANRYSTLAQVKDALTAALAEPEPEGVAALPVIPPPAPTSSASEVSEVPPPLPPIPPPSEASEVSEATADAGKGKGSKPPEKKKKEAPEKDKKSAKKEETLDELPEDDIATVEVGRKSKSSDMLDLLPTNEVSRDKVPVKKGPELKAGKEAEKLIATKATPAKKEKSGVPTWAVLVGIVCIGFAIIAITIGNNREQKVVNIGDENAANTTQTTPKETTATTVAVATDMGVKNAADAGSTTPDPTVVAALTTASQKSDAALNASLTSLAEAEKAANAADMGTNNGADAGKDSKPAETTAAAVTTNKTDNSGSSNAKTDSQTGSKVTKDTSKTDKPAPEGTNCPQGMKLVKSKSGNLCVDAYEYPGRGSTPKTRVSWFEAKKICENNGKRLCSGAEFRRACGSKYPWKGSKWDPDKCNTADADGFERSIAAAGSKATCRSRASGAYDMVGNVFEWTAEKRIVGGSFNSDEGVASCGYSSGKSPSSSAADIGFRCCASPN